MNKKTRLILLVLSAILFSRPGYCTQVPVGGTKTITTSGTAVALGTSSDVFKWLTVCAAPSNAGTVYIGASNVLAASKNGIYLNAGDCMTYNGIADAGILSNKFVDSTSSGDVVSFEYIRQG